MDLIKSGEKQINLKSFRFDSDLNSENRNHKT